MRFPRPTPLFFLSSLMLVLTAVADPLITSWYTDNSAADALVREQTGSTPVNTWPAAGLPNVNNGGATQATPVYSDIQRIAYTANNLYIESSGLASHIMGPWYLGNGNVFGRWPLDLNNRVRITRNPVPATPATQDLTPLGWMGAFVNGAAMFNLLDGFSYSPNVGMNGGDSNTAGNDVWFRNAELAEGPTFDPAGAHQPANGLYHYHISPFALRFQLGDNISYNAAAETYSEDTSNLSHSPLLGFAFDGYPVYGPYGYSSAMNPNSAITRMVSGYVLRDGNNGTTDLNATGRTTIPQWSEDAYPANSNPLTAAEHGPAVAAGANAAFRLGWYCEDYDHLADTGNPAGLAYDLDRANGRMCVTPEYPGGTFAYFTTIDAAGDPAFPFIAGRVYYGNRSGSVGANLPGGAVDYFTGGATPTYFDTTAPVITLTNPTVTVALNGVFVEPGYAVTDDFDCALDHLVSNDVATALNIAVAGTYMVTYTVTDTAGNVGTAVRTVIVAGNGADITPPVLTLIGGTVTFVVGGTFVDPGATAIDNVDGNISASITDDSATAVNPNVVGVYTVTYTVSDAAGNVATATRTVIVTPAGTTSTKPNVVLIAIDDLKPKVGAYGDTGMITPHLDAFAASGVRFDNAFSQYSICGPSRVSMLTGQRPDTLDIWNNAGASSFRATYPGIVTLPQQFGVNGYRTHGIGKVFHGNNNTTQDNTGAIVSWTDPWESNGNPPAWYEGTATSGKWFDEDNGINAVSATDMGEFNYRNSPATPIVDNDYGDGAATDLAISWLNTYEADYLANGQPFMLAVGLNKPHLPFAAPKPYWDLYNPATINLAAYTGVRTAPVNGANFTRPPATELTNYMDINGTPSTAEARHLIHGYMACVSFVDEQVGQILDHLDNNLHPSVAANTIVVIYGDHGWHLGDHGAFWTKNSNFHESNHTVMMIRAPGLAPAVETQPVELLDIYPTLLDMTGCPGPAGQTLEGASLTKLMDQTFTDWNGVGAYYQYQKNITGTANNGAGMGWTIHTEQFRYTEWYTTGVAGAPLDQASTATPSFTELYDLSLDPGELTNVVNVASYAATAAALSTQLAAGSGWQEKLNAPTITLSGADPLTWPIGTPYVDPGATAMDLEDGALVPTNNAATAVNPAVAGTYTVTFGACDSTVNESFATRTVIVAQPNQPPVLAIIPNQTVNELTPASFTAAATDPDPGQSLTYSLLPGAPAGAFINPTTGVFTWTPTEADGPGVFSVQVVVTDNGTPALADNQTVQITVNEVNQAPTISVPAAFTWNELVPLAISVSGSDADIPAQTLTYSLGAGAPAGSAINPTTGAFTWTPTEAQGPGVYSIPVTVTDSLGLATPGSFTVTVQEVDQAPVLGAIGNQSVNEGSFLSFFATASDSDLPAEALTFSLDPGAPAGASITPGGFFAWTPTEADGPGTYSITVRVSDAAPVLSDTETIQITVNEVDQAPVLSAPAALTGVELQALTFTATATDADTPVEALTFSLASGPAGATIHPVTGAFNWTPTEADGPGVFNAVIQVSDAAPVLVDAQTVVITILETNAPPVLGVIGPQNGAQSTLLTFAAVASDVDLPAQTLTFSLLNPVAGMTMTSGGVFSWTPTNIQSPGVYTSIVEVTDGLATDTEAVVFTISDSNLPPVLGAIGNQTIPEGTLLQFTATATDPDFPVQSLTYSLDTGAPSGASIHPTTGVFSWTPSETDGPGTFFATVRVTDSGVPAFSDSETVSIVVSEVNQAPVRIPPGPLAVNEGSLLSTTVAGSDADVPANNLTWTLDPGAPAGVALQPGGLLTWTPTEAQGPAQYIFDLRLSDDGSPVLDTVQTVTVQVFEVNQPPVVSAAPPSSVNEETLLSFPVSASDADLPVQVILISLGVAPAGMSIDAAGNVTWTPSEADGPGVFPVELVATDSLGLAATSVVQIAVNEVDEPPVIVPPGNISIAELAPFSLPISGADTDLPVQSTTWSLDPGAPTGLAINPATGTIAWTPSEADGPGVFPVTVRLTDAGSLSDTATFTITVTEVGQAPVLANPGAQTVDELTLLALSLSATDGDLPVETLTFSVDPGAPASLSINPASGALTWTPGEADGPGVFPVTIRVTDSAGLSDTATFNVTVNDVNTPPSLAPIGNLTLVEGNTALVTASGSDSDLPAQTLTYSLDAGAPAGALINPATGAFSWITAEGDGPGSHVITVRVTDASGASASQTFTVHVTEHNMPPVLGALPPQTVNESTAFAFTATASDSDLPANVLSFTLGSGAPAGMTINPVTGGIAWNPTELDGPGVFTVTVIATDDGSPILSDTGALVVTVLEVDTPPVLATIAPVTITEGVQVSFSATGSDSDLPAQTLTYSLDPGAPSGAAISAAGAFTWTPGEADGPGVFPVTVRLTDSTGLSDTETFQVTVNEAATPPAVVNPGPQTLNELTLLSLPITATDADLPVETLTFSVDPGAPTGLAIHPTTGVLSWTPTEADGPGLFPVTVRVTDSSGTSSIVTFQITVAEVGQAPVLANPGPQTIAELTTLSLSMSATDSDVPVQTLTFSVDAGAPAGLAVNASSGALTWTTVEADGPGSYPVTVRVTDASGLSDTATFIVTVSDVNTAPSLAPIASLTVDEGDPIAFTATGTDSDLPAQTLTYSLDAGAPTGASIHPTTGAFAWTPGESAGPGSFPITVRVTDPAGADASSSFTVTVNEVNQAPVLGSLPAQTATEGVPFTFNATASDADLPANNLTFTLGASAPSGLLMNGAGAITWTPTEADGPGVYNVNIIVTDDGSPSLNDAGVLVITVLEINANPVITPIAPISVDEGTSVGFTVAASDADLPAQVLTYSLGPGAPAGASISPSGVFNWTPGEADGPGTFSLTILVADGAGGSATETISITVNDVNGAPTLAPIAPLTGDELSPLSFQAVGSDADLPAQALTYSLGAGAPAGAFIDPNTGLFTWTPGEADGPGSFTISVVVTDASGASSTQMVTLTINEDNLDPVLTQVPSIVVFPGETSSVSLVATDADLPTQTLTYTLGAAPAGVSLVGSSLVLAPNALAVGTNSVTVQVSDGAGGTDSITIELLVPPEPIITDLVHDRAAGQMHVFWPSLASVGYELECSPSLETPAWTFVAPISASGSVSSLPHAVAPGDPYMFYRVVAP